MIKNQHVVPRSYLRSFENTNKRVFTYNWQANLCSEMKIEKICSHKYTYEVSNDKVDNLLEIELSKLESQFMPAVHNILDNVANGTLNRDCIDSEACYKYMMLQYIRSDSARVLVERAFENLKPFDHHISLEEINQNKDKTKQFNTRFKRKKELEKALNKLYFFDHPLVKVGFSRERKFLTSDNPVFVLYMPSEKSKQQLKFVLPISPNVCLYFVSRDIDKIYQKEELTFPYEISKDLAIKYNQSIVNVSNYWVVSQDEFDFVDLNSIYNRKMK